MRKEIDRLEGEC